ncbi:GNAT family N-acetyltransferase [Verrucomicrobiota bacterium]
MKMHEADCSVLDDWLRAQGSHPSRIPAEGVHIMGDENRSPGKAGLFVAGRQDGVLVEVCMEWHSAIASIASRLAPAEILSTFGAYELARATLPDGFGIWGPTWYYLATPALFRPQTCPSVRRMGKDESASVDRQLFWHAVPEPDSAGFGAFRGGRLVALAVANRRSEELWEIGIEVRPEAKGTGMGSGVFSAAGRFITHHGGLILARSAPWNVPSVRLLRRHGLRLVLQDLRLLPVPMRVPPQVLGHPSPGAALRQYYPAWAMNQDIEFR